MAAVRTCEDRNILAPKITHEITSRILKLRVVKRSSKIMLLFLTNMFAKSNDKQWQLAKSTRKFGLTLITNETSFLGMWSLVLKHVITYLKMMYEIVFILIITNVATMRNYEIVMSKFIVIGTCNSGNVHRNGSLNFVIFNLYLLPNSK